MAESNFVDYVKIYCRSGKGGRGSTHMKFFFLTFSLFGLCLNMQASEADLAIPDLHQGTYHIFGGTVSSWDFLFYGALIIVGTLGFSLILFHQIKKLKAHAFS